MRINLKLEFTNTESVMDFAEALKRLVELEEYQDWNHELTTIKELLLKAAKGLGGVPVVEKTDASQHEPDRSELPEPDVGRQAERGREEI